MAKAKGSAKKGVTRKSKDVKSFSISIEPSEDTPVYYINHAEISHGPHDFCMSVTRIPSKFSASQLTEINSGTLALEPILQLVLPVTIMDGLISALQKQRMRYEERLKSGKKEEKNGS